MATPHTRTAPPEHSPSQVCAQTASQMTAQHTHHCAAQGQHASTSARLNDMHTRGQYIPPPYSIHMLDTERRAVLVCVHVFMYDVRCVLSRTMLTDASCEGYRRVCTSRHASHHHHGHPAQVCVHVLCDDWCDVMTSCMVVQSHSRHHPAP